MASDVVVDDDDDGTDVDGAARPLLPPPWFLSSPLLLLLLVVLVSVFLLLLLALLPLPALLDVVSIPSAPGVLDAGGSDADDVDRDPKDVRCCKTTAAGAGAAAALSLAAEAGGAADDPAGSAVGSCITTSAPSAAPCGSRGPPARGSTVDDVAPLDMALPLPAGADSLLFPPPLPLSMLSTLLLVEFSPPSSTAARGRLLLLPLLMLLPVVPVVPVVPVMLLLALDDAAVAVESGPDPGAFSAASLRLSCDDWDDDDRFLPRLGGRGIGIPRSRARSTVAAVPPPAFRSSTMASPALPGTRIS
jgi:hypothetical protein